MCGAPNGRFVTGAPNDPYPLLSIVKGSNSINSAIKNKKVVRIMGHVSGLMCSRMRPRLNIRLNAGDSARDVIMPNTWTDETNTLGSSVFSIQPPCLERDGKDGKYKANEERAFVMDVVSIFITLPSIKPVSLSSSRISSYLKHPNKFIF